MLKFIIKKISLFLILFSFNAGATELSKKEESNKLQEKIGSNINANSIKISNDLTGNQDNQNVKDGSKNDSANLDINFRRISIEMEEFVRSSRKWQKLKCMPKTGFVCTKWDCLEREVNNFIILDKKNKKISSCEIANPNQCNIYDANFDGAGIFFNIQSKGDSGVLIRVLGDSRYKSIATVMLDAYIANGECTEIN